MATRVSFLTVTIPVKASSSKPSTRVQRRRNGHSELETATISLKKFTKLNKVFEDKEGGVICYRDENGELICEGYDEGPRFTCQAGRSSVEWRRLEQINEIIKRRLQLNEIMNSISGSNGASEEISTKWMI